MKIIVTSLIQNIVLPPHLNKMKVMKMILILIFMLRRKKTKIKLISSNLNKMKIMKMKIFLKLLIKNMTKIK